MKKKILISDIAKELNISITTVSFILNGKAKEKRISDSLTAKVLKLVEEVDYRPNQLAQSLRTGKTNTIGLMVEDISNPFFASIARKIEEKAYSEGYKIIYCSTEDNAEKTRDLISMFKGKLLDGYIITPPSGIEEEVQKLISEGLPVVLVDRTIGGLDTNTVVVDNLTGAYDATCHLYEQGFKKIAYITTDSTQTQMQLRLEGYQKAADSYGFEPLVLEIPFGNEADAIVQQVRDYLAEHTTVDAVFFATNYLGVRGLEAIESLGMPIPSRIGVVSYDDNDVFKLHKPSITAVAQPTDEIANHTISIMLDLLKADNQKTSASQSVMLPTQLIIRDSSRRR